MAKISHEDAKLLQDLSRRGGRACIFDGKPREGAERLVAAGYATSRALNLSDIEYEITPSGEAAVVLGESLGRYDLMALTIETTRFAVDGGWMVGVSSPGDPALLMQVNAASSLADRLRAVGAVAVAERFETEAARARRYAMSNY